MADKPDDELSSPASTRQHSRPNSVPACLLSDHYRSISGVAKAGWMQESLAECGVDCDRVSTGLSGAMVEIMSGGRLSRYLAGLAPD